jgi:hypothetical protein
MEHTLQWLMAEFPTSVQNLKVTQVIADSGDFAYYKVIEDDGI